MYDSTNGFDIPQGVDMVAGYTDGLYRWSDAMWQHHASSVHVRICVVSIDMSAHVADIERGGLTATEGAEFVKQKHARGEWPSLYFSASLLPTVQAALSAAGLDPYHSYSLWVALWDDVPEQWDGAVAKQYTHPPNSGGHYDKSIVIGHWQGVDK